MSKKNEQHITPAELAEVNKRQEASQHAQNALARAKLSAGVSEQDLVEYHQQLARRYRLKDGDVLDGVTGEIRRKG